MPASSVQCCIAGGGPSGMMLGLLLARAGVDVMVLEKHSDFLRDFRGDTIHPSTLELLHELGLLERFLTRPHQQVTGLDAVVAGNAIPVADFRHLPTHCRFLAFMPQWDFLDLLKEAAQRYANFALHMHTEVVDLVTDQGRIAGVKVISQGREQQIRADLVVGADGRQSVVRDKAELPINDLGAPMDVLWLRLSRQPGDPDQPQAHFNRGRLLVMIYRETYWQCGYVIQKGELEALRDRGIDHLHEVLRESSAFICDRVQEIGSWDEVKLLSVKVDRLVNWYREGLLCLGDAAHAMSPVGGVGINLAIQDSVAAANLLAQPLREGRMGMADLRAVQARRLLPTRVTQRAQVLIQNRIISRVLSSDKPLTLPLPLKLLRRFALLRRIPARLIGMGFRPEHVAPGIVIGEGKR